MAKILLIDGYSIINRAYYGLPLLTNSYGEHTNGVYGFMNIMLKIMDEEQPQYLAVAFDVKAPTFRHNMFSEYKGTRKPMPTELTEQVPLLKDLLQAMDIPCVSKAGFEADDIIGTLSVRAAKEGMDVVILSGDRDLLQLATKTTMVRIPKTSKGKTEVYNYLEEDVVREYGATPKEFIDMKALMGDTSDNIPGLPGVGEKTAQAIIEAYHSIENAYEHRADIKPNKAKLAFEEHYDLAVLSKKLATIELDAPIDFTMEDAKLGEIFTARAYELMKRHNFKSLYARFEAAAKQAKTTTMPKTEVVEDYDEVARIFSMASHSDEVGLGLALDKKERGAGFELNGVALSFVTKDEERSCFIPCAFFVTSDYLCREIRSLMEKTRVILFETKPLLHVLSESFDIVNETSELLKPLEDISLLAYLLNPLSGEYSYEELAEQYLSITLPTKKEVFDKKSFMEMQMVAPNELAAYYGNQATVVRKLFEILKKEVKKVSMDTLYETIEKPLVFSMFSMEYLGVRVDAKALKEYGDLLSVKITKMEESIIKECGEEQAKGVNLNSPKQLGELLFEKLGLPGGKKTKSGYSTSADVLDKLAADYPVVSKILEYRQLTKLKSTYADGLGTYICADGRIHGTFHQTITATGRISSADPNLQNIPTRTELGRELRKLFVPKEGHVFIDADYSQIELRILADMSGDERLISAYRMAEDIHAVTASQVFHVPLSEVTPTLRRNAKAVNFGIVYGISAFGLSEDLSISKKEAAEYIERYFETYPGIKEFLDRLVQSAKDTGYSNTKYDRIRPIPELKSSNFMQRSFGERVAMNAPIQGTAADIMKIAMINVDRELRKQGFAARILLQVHDELLLEVPDSEKEAVKELLISCMKQAATLKVMLEVSAEVGANWYETK